VTIAHEYSKVPPHGGVASLGQTFSFKLPIIGEFINDCVMYVKLVNFAAVSALDKVRYVEYLGHRLMKNVRFKVQNFEVDSYTPDEANAYFQFKVPQHKEIGYLRDIGQEVPTQAFLTADPSVDEVREYRYFGYGPQTFKQTQPTLEMWIPILFWFRELGCSLPNFILPMQQTEIEIEFERESNLVAYANYGGGGTYVAPAVSECYLYVNHIFLLPEINKIFVDRFGGQLIRVHRKHTETLVDSEAKVKLHQLKWPLECLYIGFRPTSNDTNSQLWHRMNYSTATTFHEAVVTGVNVIQVNSAEWWNEKHVVKYLSLLASDIIIYPKVAPAFYNGYIPYRYGNQIKTPKDLGWYMMNFNFNPGEYQPSGHFNSSRSREIYLHYVSDVDSGTLLNIIRPANPVKLVVLADALNFILFKGNNMTLKFST
jgi:hypothetical protein